MLRFVRCHLENLQCCQLNSCYTLVRFRQIPLDSSSLYQIVEIENIVFFLWSCERKNAFKNPDTVKMIAKCINYWCLEISQ